MEIAVFTEHPGVNEEQYAELSGRLGLGPTDMPAGRSCTSAVRPRTAGGG